MASLSATSPSLLPSLKFHELVFGHALGQGSFSTVFFAKRIVRGTAGSAWPVYACKVYYYNIP